MKMQLPEDRKEEGTAAVGGGRAGRKSPTCVGIASPLGSTGLFALEPVGRVFAVSCWLCAEQEVVCVLAAAGHKKEKKKRKGKEGECCFSWRPVLWRHL